MIAHAPCPNCRGTNSQPVGFTWWGGLLGPKLLNHVKCQACGTAYNGKSGKSNANAIAIYVVVTGVIVMLVMIALVALRLFL